MRLISQYWLLFMAAFLDGAVATVVINGGLHNDPGGQVGCMIVFGVTAWLNLFAIVATTVDLLAIYLPEIARNTEIETGKH